LNTILHLNYQFLKLIRSPNIIAWSSAWFNASVFYVAQTRFKILVATFQLYSRRRVGIWVEPPIFYKLAKEIPHIKEFKNNREILTNSQDLLMRYIQCRYLFKKKTTEKYYLKFIPLSFCFRNYQKHWRKVGIFRNIINLVLISNQLLSFILCYTHVNIALQSFFLVKFLFQLIVIINIVWV
jgi:hypothetical protein